MNAQNSFSVLIPDGESEFALFVAHCFAPFPNAKLHVISSERWSPIRLSRYCASYTCVDTEADDRSRLEMVADVVRQKGIDVILPTETKWISFAVANREALSSFVSVAPLPDPQSFAIANNKWLLAQFLQDNQIPCPPTVLLTYDDAFDKRIQDLEFPVLLKPVSAWGGEGIERFETLADLKRHLDQQDQAATKEQFIVQSLLPGFVVGVNVLSRNGEMLATTMQRGLIPNVQKYAAAGAIRFIREEAFAGIAQRLVSAFGWSGFANVDTLYDSRDEQLKILEINARFWGSLRGSFVAGVSFPYLACLTALNIPFPMPEYQLARYFHPTTVLRERIRGLVGKNRQQLPTFKESGLRFLWADLLAEGARAFRQLILDREPARQ